MEEELLSLLKRVRTSLSIPDKDAVTKEQYPSYS